MTELAIPPQKVNVRIKEYKQGGITFKCIFPDKQTTEEELQVISNKLYILFESTTSDNAGQSA